MAAAQTGDGGMRTVPPQKVFNRIVELLGNNSSKKVRPDIARTAMNHLNERVATIEQLWPWPEWEVTEERAFRQIWNLTTQYSKTGTDGKPDEVYDIGDTATNRESGYFRVRSDIPSNPLPTVPPSDTNFWEPMDEPFETYIAYDQRCRRTIGMVVGVYSKDPRLGCGCNGSEVMKFHPGEK